MTTESVPAREATLVAPPPGSGDDTARRPMAVLVGLLVGVVVCVVLMVRDGGDSPVMIGVLGLCLMLLLMGLRIPVAISLIVAAVGGYATIVGVSPALARLGSDAFLGAASYTLSVIPLFIMMGLLLAGAGLGTDLYRAIDVFAWRLRGGLGVATIGAAALFGAVSGSAIASATTMSIVAVPEMRRYDYEDGFAVACAAAGGTLGILIPPSAALVLYGIVTEESIGQLLVGGIVPGLMTTALLMVTAWLLVRRTPSLAPRAAQRPTLSKFRAVMLVWAVPVIFGLSMGGLYLGLFTPTESGAVGAFLSLLYGVVTRRLTWKSFLESMSRTIRTSALIFLLVIAGKMFGFFLSITRIPTTIGDWILGLDMAPSVVMLAMFVVYFIAGALMDEIALLIIMTPITYPIAIGLGYDGIWFGVLTIMMLLVGMLAPPVGMLCFVTSGITKIPLEKVYRSILPFVLTISVAVIIAIMFPQIITFLPDLMR